MGEVTVLRRAAALMLFAAVVGPMLAVVAAPAALAADPITFGQGSGSSKFGQFLEFKQPVTVPGSVDHVDVLVATAGAVGPTVVPLAPGTPSGASTLDYRLDLSDGHIVPNTPFTVQFRVTEASGATAVGPAIHYVYDDDRFKWKTLEGSVVRVHWVDGDQAFGQRALRIGDGAVSDTAKLLGVAESDPIDFFIYPDQASFYDALGPATRENVGGQAHPDIRTLFALITPDEIDASWVESVVPHELTHVVFATAVDNPYHDPPHWLNEGLAVYLSDSYQESDKSQVEAAAKDGSIIPLDGLAGAFPTTRDRFFLAYAESVSAVDRIVRVDGRDALIKLIRSYHDGVSDDDAFRAALGRDVAGFEKDWLAELGAKPPARLGPRPAPAGPLPAGWSGPQPDPSFEVVGSQPPATPNTPFPGPDGDVQTIWSFWPVLAIGLVLLVALVVAFVRLARRPPLPAAETPGDNRLFGRQLSGGDGPAEDGGSDVSSSLWTSTDWSLPKDVADAGDTSGEAAAPPTDVPNDPPDGDQPLHNPER